MNFTLIRGDNVTLTVPLYRGGALTEPGAGAELIFTAKDSTATADASARFQKILTGGVTLSGSTASVEILHADTKTLTDTQLYWDVQVRETSGAVWTGNSGFLFIDHDVTREVNPAVSINTTNPITSFASLTTRISTEESTRSSADASLTSRISTEESVRAGLKASDINDDSEVAVGSVADGLNSLLTDVDEIRSSSLRALIISGSQTATLNRLHIITANATLSDPTPSEGAFFEVIVRNGTATVGGTAYSTPGDRIIRIYHSGAWASYRYAAT